MVQSPKPPTKSAVAPKILAAVGAAILAVSPLTMHSEGTVYKAYLDPVKVPTICNGHTKGVKLGDVATEDQCRQYFREDMTATMLEDIRVTPNLVNNKNALMAVGDMTFNTGLGAYIGSPMAVNFSKGNWVAGCNAFVGYYTGGTFDKPQPKYKCKPHAKKPGKWLCELPGLVTRRLNEQKICLTGSF